MGVKSTQVLTREEAERKYVYLMAADAERQLRSSAVAMDDKTLEDVLEVLNDRANEGEGFENYLIQAARI